MRIEQIIAAVTRTLVVANVREICRVVTFVAASRLHRWQMRMLLGMPCYCSLPLSGDLSRFIDIDDRDGRAVCFSQGGKRGKQLGQLNLAPANCQQRSASA